MNASAEAVSLARQRLWPAGAAAASVWAVLDLARDPRIYALLLESRLEFLSLYSGRLPRELERVSPHMVELLPGHAFTARLIEQSLGMSWCVFMRIDDPTALRPHLRKLLKVRAEDGRTLIFRWYDPRVLRAYLPTCRPDEQRAFFGPMTSMWAEGEGGRSLLEFRFDRRGFGTQTIPLAEEVTADADDPD